MPIGANNLIEAADYNAIQTVVARVLSNGGSPDATYGYGQTPASAQVAAGNTVSASHLLNLKADLDSISIHQSNSASSAPSVASGGIIYASDWSTYSSQATSLESTRFNSSSAQMALTDKINPTFSNWNGTRTHVVTVTFASADAGRYYFNTGGEIRMYPSHSGYSSGTSKGGRWNALFSSFSPVRFNYTSTTASGGTGSSIGWYDLTSSDQQIFTAVDSGTYSGNDITVFARCDVASNSGGTASVLTLTIQFNDDGTFGATPPGDENVDGTTTSKISTYRAVASTPPAGATVTVSDPTVATSSGP